MFIPLNEQTAEIIKKQLEPTNMDKFLKVCLDALDTDVTPRDTISDEFACAEVVSTLIKKVFPDFPILTSTKDLDFKLFTDKRFKRETEPAMGRIVISPRTTSVNGHVGVWITNEKIASNNSVDGVFRGNLTWQEWVNEYKIKKGLRVYIYSLI